MKKTAKKTNNISKIQETLLNFEQKQICFDILKKHINPKQKITVAVS
jgi:hypothetical protein